MQPIKTETHAGCTIELHYDEEGATVEDNTPEDVTFWAWHRRMRFGPTPPCSPSEIAEHLPKGVLVLPVYAYEHGGITISVGSFSCLFDSGQLGVIFAPLQGRRFNEATQRWVKCRTKAEREEQTRKYLTSVVKCLDDCVTGRVYGFIVKDADGEYVDSCWGFVGDEDYVLHEARQAAESHEKQMSRTEQFVDNHFAL